MRVFVATGVLLLLSSLPAISQQSYGRIDIRCLLSNNEITFKTADTNVAIGYAAWRNPNPRATIVAQKQVNDHWAPLTFQFMLRKNDSVTVILRGRYQETEPTGELIPEWVWVDNVSVTDTNREDLCRNGSFEELRGNFPRPDRHGQPEKWGYKGKGQEIKSDSSGKFPEDGNRCIKVWHSLAAHQSIRLHSNHWYTVTAYFRAE